MTQDEIIEMARQAGMMDTWDGWVSRSVYKASGLQTEDLIAFAKLVEDAAFVRWAAQTKLSVQEERETCAQIGDTALYQLQETMNELGEHEYMERCVVQGAMNQAAKFTKAIRARGEA